MRFYRDWTRLVRTILAADPVFGVATVLFQMLRGGLDVLDLLLFKGLIDAILARAGWGAIGWWLAAMTGLIAVHELVRRLVPVIQGRLELSGEALLTERLLRQAARTPLLLFESPIYYDRLARAHRGVGEGMRNLVEASLWVTREFFGILFIGAAIVALSPWAALPLVLVGVPAWVAQALMAGRVVALHRAQIPRQRYAGYLSFLLTKRQFAQEVRLFGLTAELAGRYRHEAGRLADERISLQNRVGIGQGLTAMLGHLGYIGSLGLLGHAALRGSLSVGGFGAAIKTVGELQGSVSRLVFNLGRLHQSAPFVADLWDFLDERPAGMLPDSSGPTARLAEAPAVAFEQVTFAYPGRPEPVLTDVTFGVRPGELVALVGENGAGKTTLVKLLLGLYPPSQGRVLVGGIDPYSSEGATVRSSAAAVFQDYLKYAFTAGENIGVGDASAMTDHHRIVQAALKSGADAVVARLPKEYETQLGREFQGGVELSGGEWQKLAIGRAYMREALLLVLDEPTAALDPQAELEVFRHFRQMARGRTAFLISHRLGAARLADRILVLKQGRLVEDGHHHQLMALGGEYASLFETQAHWYRGENAG